MGVVKGLDALYKEIVVELTREIERSGADDINRAFVVKKFEGRAGRSTIYKLVDRALRSFKPQQNATKAIRKTIADRQRRGQDSSAVSAKQVVAMLPGAVLTADDIVKKTGSMRSALEYVQNGMDHIERVAQKCYSPDGRVVVMSKLLLSAMVVQNSYIRTANALADKMTDVNKIQDRIDEIFAEVSKESPECAERIKRRLSHHGWG